MLGMLEAALTLAVLATLALFVYRVVKRLSLYGVPLSRSLANAARYEVASAFRSPINFMHFSIIVGIALSAIYSIYVDPIIWALSLPFIVGLAMAAVWRLVVLQRSVRLNAALAPEGRIAAESAKMQSVLLVIIILTLLDVALALASPLLSKSVAVFRNLMLLAYYVKPASNLIANSGRGLAHFRMPFDLRSVLEGKVAAEDVKPGYATVGDVDRDVLLSCDSCGEIGACDSVCPAVSAGRALSPRLFVRTIALNAGKPDYPVAQVLEEAAWACTTCGACVSACPVRVRHLDAIYGVRRALVAEGKLDKKKGDLLLSLSQYGNSLTRSNMDRHGWLRELGLKTVEENPGFEYLLWVGCMGSFDSRARQIIEAFVGLLREAGVLDKFAVLGDAETCCGDPARRLGEESRFQEIALSNGELFAKYGVRRIVTICPHGYNAFKNEYPQLGVKIEEVVHHSEFLARLIDEGLIRPGASGETYTIHDPCYLARYNDVVKPQRKVVVRVGRIAEADRNGRNTMCCGAGGANYWYDVATERERISHVRAKELGKTGANVVVTMCPFCNAMIGDAVRTRNMDVKVMDIAEVLRHALGR